MMRPIIKSPTPKGGVRYAAFTDHNWAREQLADLGILDDVLNSTNNEQEAELAMEKSYNAIKRIGREFFRAADDGDYEKVEEALKNGFPVNLADSRNGLTALHYAASANATKTVDVLMSAPGIDLLIRDKWGRLASELTRDSDLMGKMVARAVEQAKERGQWPFPRRASPAP